MKDSKVIRLCMITKEKLMEVLNERMGSEMMMLFSHGGVKIAMRSLYNAAKNGAELRKRRIAKILRRTRHEQERNLRRLEKEQSKLEKSIEINFAVILRCFSISRLQQKPYLFSSLSPC